MNFLRNLFSTRRSSAKRMVEGFIRRFLGKCMICSYHRFGMEHGFVRLNESPEPHHCLDKS